MKNGIIFLTVTITAAVAANIALMWFSGAI